MPECPGLGCGSGHRSHFVSVNMEHIRKQDVDVLFGTLQTERPIVNISLFPERATNMSILDFISGADIGDILVYAGKPHACTFCVSTHDNPQHNRNG